MIETEIITALAADTTVTGIVGTRVYPIVMPQNVTLPAVTYQRVGAGRINTLSGYAGLANPHIVLNSWATRYDEAKELADDIRDCMNKASAFAALLINDMDGYDPETGIYVVSQDFSIWNAE